MTRSTTTPKAVRRPAPGRKTLARPYHHGNLRTTLLDAADAVLAERGVQGITLRDVARSAGVSHAAPYHHFASLEELLAAVAERGFRVLGEAMASAVAVAGAAFWAPSFRVTQCWSMESMVMRAML